MARHQRTVSVNIQRGAGTSVRRERNESPTSFDFHMAFGQFIIATSKIRIIHRYVLYHYWQLCFTVTLGSQISQK